MVFPKKYILLLMLSLVSTSCAAQELPDIVGQPKVKEQPKLPYADRLKAQHGLKKIIVSVPQPRGKIYGEYVDGQGNKKQTQLATSITGYYFQIELKSIINETDSVKIYEFVKSKMQSINAMVGRSDSVDQYTVLTYFENRRWFPMRVGSMLNPSEIKKIQNKKLPDSVSILEVPIRYYPRETLAAHVIGVVKRVGNWSISQFTEQNNLLFPDFEGTRGLEKSQDDILRGEPSVLEYRFDEKGDFAGAPRVIKEGFSGGDIVISLDTEMQRITENILKEHTKKSRTFKGAMVVLDVETMQIKALASWPLFNPNAFVPVVTSEKMSELTNDKNNPLLARAFQAAYPPASVFKIATSFIALASQLVQPNERRYNCLNSVTYHSNTMRNWTKEPGEPAMTVSEALMRSCNTWFFQAANELQSKDKYFEKWFHALIPMLGLGSKTGLGFSEEVSGSIYKKDGVAQPFYEGAHVANISIGQGELLTSPLQIAQMMARIANEGQNTKATLVKARKQNAQPWISLASTVDQTVKLSPYYRALSELRLGLWDVVHDQKGTGVGARSNSFDVVGKTGSAQWSQNRNVAWFASYAPFYNGSQYFPHRPKYVVVSMQEGNSGQELAGGNHGAPLVGAFFNSAYVNDRMSEHMGMSAGRGILRALPVESGGW